MSNLLQKKFLTVMKGILKITKYVVKNERSKYYVSKVSIEVD